MATFLAARFPDGVSPVESTHALEAREVPFEASRNLRIASDFHHKFEDAPETEDLPPVLFPVSPIPVSSLKAPAPLPVTDFPPSFTPKKSTNLEAKMEIESTPSASTAPKKPDGRRKRSRYFSPDPLAPEKKFVAQVASIASPQQPIDAKPLLPPIGDDLKVTRAVQDGKPMEGLPVYPIHASLLGAPIGAIPTFNNKNKPSVASRSGVPIGFIASPISQNNLNVASPSAASNEAVVTPKSQTRKVPRVQHECPVDGCGSSFTNRTVRDAHISSLHPGVAAFSCDHCSKTYMKHETLHRHLRQHRTPTETCDICGQMFVGGPELRRHYRSHTGEKPFECEHCGRKFATATQKNDHRRIHTGELPYECTVCQKKFRRTANLRTHSVVHTGEKPYECMECGVKYTQYGTLKKHLVKFHEEQKQI